MQVAEQRPALTCKNPGCHGILLTIGRRSICSVCRQITSAPRVKHQERRKTDLSDQQVVDMLALARSRNPRDFTILGFLASGFRRSEIVGGDDNGVTLPGVQVEDVHVDEEYAWIHGKNDKEIQQPVPRLILEPGLSFGGREGKLIEWVTTHAVGELVKAYAESCGLPDAQLVTSHRFRHWFSRRVKEHGGLKPGVEGLVEWADVMRHSRKGLGGVTTVGYYNGPFTTFQRRHEIVKSALQGILDQVARLAARKNDSTLLRIFQDSTLSGASKDSERGQPHDSIVYNTPISGSSSESDSNPTPVETDHRCEWAGGCTENATVHISPGWFCEPHSHDPFGELVTPTFSTRSSSKDTVDQSELPATPSIQDPFAEEECPVTNSVDVDTRVPETEMPSLQEPVSGLNVKPPPSPATPTREQILRAWQDGRNYQRGRLERERQSIKDRYGWRERQKRLDQLKHCQVPGCHSEAYGMTPTWRVVCKVHYPETPPDSWKP